MNNYSSIAFPALGTGNLNCPPAKLAECFIEAAAEYPKIQVFNMSKLVMIACITIISEHVYTIKLFVTQILCVIYPKDAYKYVYYCALLISD